ncbi:type VI secretion system Vgr family protein [Polyangium jinanense]|uniref:Type VI secretion system tip protein VgrG n=1 Tax=Polyangium jinanense TaxID=2829994 RepID=A0A9X3X1W2_9BACT|nr:type VI secretion system tip protein TssI/VgrG [Polyangium jinanense]MDC3957227.1 type VI secretion system tip protein VgrG [Polyangium jinanense]MDC3982629.1 type VI secretion system tip protein VgrG [Polyangium jinanense]
MVPIAHASQTNHLRITTGSSELCDVRQYSVTEQISSLFVVDLVVVSENLAIEFDAVVGKPARFTIVGDRYERSWSGLCNRFQLATVEEKGLSTYELTIVPDLWLATQRRNHRRFQHVSEPDIVLRILDEWGIQPEMKLSATYKKREYRVQYGESDYAFMCRMLEDAGISFYFVQAGTETRLVLSDAPHRSEQRGSAIAFKDDISMVTGEYATQVHVGQQVRPGRYTLRDNDYRLRADYQLVLSAEEADLEIERKLERYHYVPGAFLFGTDTGEGTPFADAKGKSRTDEAEGAILLQKRLDAKREDARICTFETNALDLAPGTVLTMLDHPRPELGPDRRLLVVKATHAGTPFDAFSQRCEARSADIPYRPPLATPKPKAIGIESATVVGPPGEEIHTDEFGRVRVHFHWDRESKMDEDSSCWIHVSQPLAGPGFGVINLPRVGQEVLVDFLGGDPDRPVIVGRVYTNVQKVPYTLPENKTQSGWKSQSTPGGGGSNELRFEDAKGRELVFLQAERDQKSVVKNDEAITVGNDRTKRVQNDETVSIGNNRTKLVTKNEALTIGNDRTKLVQNDEMVSIGNNRTKLVQNDEEVTIGNDRTKLVQNDEEVTIGNDQTKLVGNNEREVTGVNRSIVVGVNRSAQIGAVDAVTVGEMHTVSVASSSSTMTDQKIVFDTGAGATITMEGAHVRIDAAESVTISKKKIVLDTGAGATITLDGSSVEINALNISIIGGNAVNVAGVTQTNVGGISGLTLGAPSGDIIIRGVMVKLN